MNKILCNVAIFTAFLLCLLIVLKLMTRSRSLAIENFATKHQMTDNGVIKVKRPFVNIFDQKGRALNVILVSKPFSGDREFNLLKDYKEKHIIIGVSSYLEFPNMVTNPFENFTENYKKYRYKENCEGWIYPFKNPEDYFPPAMPTLFASESDWTDCNFMKPDISPPKKKYDFIYICLKVNEKKETCDDWATWNKNWELAKKCLAVFCSKYKLKGLLVGRKGCPLPDKCNTLMETTNMVKYSELKKLYAQARFIFVPNEKDASPRVLTEALCMNIPALVNENILGGWKYINEETGMFFKDENDVGEKAKEILDNIAKKQYNPRKFFVEKYGNHNSGEKLRDFLFEHWKDRLNIPKEEIEYLTPEFNRKNYKKCSA